jgi:uncharacterized protein YjbJ (UPF0337 family)
MKKTHMKIKAKEMPGKVNEVAAKVVGFREPGHEGSRQTAHGTMEAAFSVLQNQYRKAG